MVTLRVLGALRYVVPTILLLAVVPTILLLANDLKKVDNEKLFRSVPSDVALVEIAAPARTRILIDGHEQDSRKVTFGPLKKGQLALHELTARFSSGGTVSKT